jgi:hypothetical protein
MFAKFFFGYLGCTQSRVLVGGVINISLDRDEWILLPCYTISLPSDFKTIFWNVHSYKEGIDEVFLGYT